MPQNMLTLFEEALIEDKALVFSSSGKAMPLKSVLNCNDQTVTGWFRNNVKSLPMRHSSSIVARYTGKHFSPEMSPPKVRLAVTLRGSQLGLKQAAAAPPRLPVTCRNVNNLTFIRPQNILLETLNLYIKPSKSS